MGKPPGEAEVIEQFFCPFLGRRFRLSLDVGGYANVFQSGELRQQVVKLKNEPDALITEMRQILDVQFENIRSVNDDLALVGGIERSEDVEKGTFPGTGFTDDADDFTLPDFNVHALEHVEVAVGFVYVGGFDHVGRQQL